MAVNHLIKGAIECKLERPRFGYIAPTFKQAKAVAWDYLKHYTSVIPGAEYNEAELRCDLPWGARIRLFGADNPDSLRGIYLDGVVLDEFPLMQGRTWSEIIRPLLTDRQGWALFIGTPNGKNAFWDLYTKATGDNWYRALFKASETGVILASELEDAKQSMSPDEYAQEFECSFEASIRGAIYAQELQRCREDGRIQRLPYDPALSVNIPSGKVCQGRRSLAELSQGLQPALRRIQRLPRPRLGESRSRCIQVSSGKSTGASQAQMGAPRLQPSEQND
jgi:hypothetical protein